MFESLKEIKREYDETREEMAQNQGKIGRWLDAQANDEKYVPEDTHEVLKGRIKAYREKGWVVERVSQNEAKLMKRNRGSGGEHAAVGLLTAWWTFGLGNAALANKREKESPRVIIEIDEEFCTYNNGALISNNNGLWRIDDSEPVSWDSEEREYTVRALNVRGFETGDTITLSEDEIRESRVVGWEG